MSEIYLSLVIPSYDEMANLQKGVLDKVKRFLDSKKYVYEVIVVDDGSKDGGIEFVGKFSQDNPTFKLIKNNHSGKAGAVTTGVLSAKGKYVLFADMDQATPIEEMDKLLPFFSKGYQVVIGSRQGQRQGAPLIRKFISQANIILRRIIIGVNDIADTQCGFKMFSQDTAKDLFTKMNVLHHGFSSIFGSSVSSGFDVELLYLAQKRGYKIKEVPVKWLYVETRRVNPIRDSFDGIVALLQIKINDLRKIYS